LIIFTGENKIKSLKSRPWYQNAIFYEVYIRAFADGNGDGHGDFIGLTDKLDYLVDLGVDCIWISPMYPSPLLDDGYDISDHYNIHPDYGSLEDFKTFVRTAHSKGLRVIADLVLNHTSDQHPWFQEARKDRKSPFRDYYVWSDTDQKYRDARIIFLDTEESNWTWDETAGQFFWHRFYSSQPDLNYDNPAVRDEILNIIRFWMDLGLDGFRADAVPYLYEREGTNCENLPETHAYLKSIRQFIDSEYPGRILLAEANQWPVDLLPYFGDGDEFHVAFHFPIMPRIFMSLRKTDYEPIVKIMAETPAIPQECQWCIFLRNHDELTLEMVTEQERQWMWQEYAPEPRMRLNLGIRRRLAPLLDNDKRKIELANSILFTLPGVPIIYYGDEIGMGDNIWLKDRDGVRTPMQWNDQRNGGFSSADPKVLYSPVIDDEFFGYSEVNVAGEQAGVGTTWHSIRKMIQIRKRYPLFGNLEYKFLLTENRSVLPILRSTGNAHMLAINNLSGKDQHISLDLSKWIGSRMIDLIKDSFYGLIPREPMLIHLEPYEYLWLQFAS
jgi:maltose alpha-D-glucosyltransferase/alpha-amylase